MTKSTITREQLEEWVAQFDEDGGCDATDRQLEALIRQSLAALDSEPVFNLLVSQAGYKGQKQGNNFGFTTLDAARELKEGKYQLYRHAQPAPVVPEGLNPETTDLVLRFASALADKLYKAEQKYGRSTDWMKDDWYDDCLQSLWEHIEKGDPRDVAAYCAFMWYHGWVTTDYYRNVQNACRAAMLQAGNSPVIGIDLATGADKTVEVRYVAPPGYVMVPKEPTETMINAWLSEVANWRGHVAGYKAMLAAAPQEVK
ncbi:hypothetical protein [Klebsiella grimontii]|uniref:hypothetical protein n=1 Tax=Klebsiella grimontii TaxID=2058152 RepID=UPI0020C2A2CB|nr:hypothetical protein [Klebsiella grimontii]UTJ40427.1 hypothetical protein NLZ17_17645 [Klebsiella grimontii]